MRERSSFTPTRIITTMTTINAKQHRLYLIKWAAVKSALVKLGGYSNAEAEAMRHEIHIEALAVDKSSKLFTNPDLDRVLDAFDTYLISADPRQACRAVTMPRKRLIWAIANKGFPDEYLNAIARDVFRVEDWRTLPDSDLIRFKLTATSRARAHARKAKDAETGRRGDAEIHATTAEPALPF